MFFFLTFFHSVSPRPRSKWYYAWPVWTNNRDWQVESCCCCSSRNFDSVLSLNVWHMKNIFARLLITCETCVCGVVRCACAYNWLRQTHAINIIYEIFVYLFWLRRFCNVRHELCKRNVNDFTSVCSYCDKARHHVRNWWTNHSIWLRGRRCTRHPILCQSSTNIFDGASIHTYSHYVLLYISISFWYANGWC